MGGGREGYTRDRSSSSSSNSPGERDVNDAVALSGGRVSPPFPFNPSKEDENFGFKAPCDATQKTEPYVPRSLRVVMAFPSASLPATKRAKIM
ncbi:hypothetical protein Pmani_035987 [Petrolisthes manimaculis]|uniref:Uncharacterized protein n=1 Tax=Petrolisthes manimaculis TaxID=1843537 RepID=A0AAE1NLW3_9EUCA|nr:hypothetical protein Pmani_035987 [Petrolisthes manimaculis]